MRSIKHRDNALSYLHFLLKGESEMESRRRFKAFALNNKRKRKKAIVPGGRVHARSTGRSSQSRAAVPAATVRSGLGTWTHKHTPPITISRRPWSEAKRQLPQSSSKVRGITSHAWAGRSSSLCSHAVTLCNTPRKTFFKEPTGLHNLNNTSLNKALVFRICRCVFTVLLEYIRVKPSKPHMWRQKCPEESQLSLTKITVVGEVKEQKMLPVVTHQTCVPQIMKLMSIR